MLGACLLTVLVVLLIVLDIRRKISLVKVIPLSCFLAVAGNNIVLCYVAYQYMVLPMDKPTYLPFLAPFVLYYTYMWLRLHIFPVLDGNKAGIRLKTMIGGRFIAICGFWMFFLEGLFLIISWRYFERIGVPVDILVYNAVYGLGFAVLLSANGILRMFFTSRRLSVIRRIVIWFTIWIPLVNILVLFFMCRTVVDEYDFALYKNDLNQTRVDSDICQTKYPLVMVHGVLFRDLKYFNYWGRIPKELKRYGATVYYGNQEALGSIEYNAQEIKETILCVIEETGCEKVNIIAHSKGGLDSRYAVSMLGMDKYVASMTCLCTPHRGCRFLDVIYKLPDGFFRFLARIFDWGFRMLGDEEPDFFHAIRQFATGDSDTFNSTVLDSPDIYYQSYAGRMKHVFSDGLLALPFLMITPLEGANDGLVSVESAKWGNFRGVLSSTGRRGVSHADMIDLRRDDYRGFDAIENMIGIVSELKEMGY